MFKIRTMNAISEHGTGALEKRGCVVGPDVEAPDALLIRSADLHGMEFNPELLIGNSRENLARYKELCN